MSLVLDNLKKLKRQSGGGSVPPGMMNSAPKTRRSGRPNAALMVLLAVALAGAGIVLFAASGSSYQPDTQFSGQEPVQQVLTLISPEQIQAKIDSAVKEALSEAERNFADKLAGEDADIRRMDNTSALPASFVNKTVYVPAPKLTPVPEPESMETNRNGNGEQNVRGDLPAEKSELKSVRPVINEIQKAEFDRKMTFNTLITQGENLLRSNNFDRAIEKYEKALMIRDSETALSKLIKALIGKGDLSSVEKLLKNYRGVLSNNVITTAALDLENAGHSEKGLDLLKSYTGSFGNDGGLYYTAGQILERSKEYIKAEAAYRTALAQFPADIYYLYAYARMLDTNMKLSEAADTYKKITELDTDESLRKTASDREELISGYLRMKEEMNEKDTVIINSGAESLKQ